MDMSPQGRPDRRSQRHSGGDLHHVCAWAVSGHRATLLFVSAPAANYREWPGCHPGVAAVWTFHNTNASQSLVAADGCFDLILSISPGTHPSGFIYRPEARAQCAQVEPNAQLHGVRLSQGYGAALNIDCKQLIQMAERDFEAGAGPFLLETLVIPFIEDIGTPPAVIADFLEHARHSQGSMRLTDSRIGGSSASERELQRASHRWLGLTPKAFLRIERAWAARDAIRSGQPLAAIAADLGFSDQAHLGRELRMLLGVTPRQLRPVGILQEPRPRQR